MSDRYLWLVYVALAGLAWGIYVPIIFYGGSELGGKPNARLMSILCVGIAYFVIGVLFPLVMFLTGQHPLPEMKPTGLIFSGLAGVAGAVGAICVIYATSSARAAAGNQDPDAYRILIAPLIFGLAPVINTLVSIVWHPGKGEPFRFGFTMPNPLLWVGIILVSVGAALVLYSKEKSEPHPPAAPAPSPKVGTTFEPPPATPGARL